VLSCKEKNKHVPVKQKLSIIVEEMKKTRRLIGLIRTPETSELKTPFSCGVD